MIFVAIGDSGIYRSSDNGESWIAVNAGISNRRVHALATRAGEVYAATDDMGAYRSLDNGCSWQILSRGLSTGTLGHLAVGDEFLFAASNAGVWRRPIAADSSLGSSEFATIPNAVTLEQNFPNPFNPTTRILYSVPFAEHVNLTLYNVLGERVRVLVDQDVAVGWHEALVDAAGLPSGTYFYRLESNGSIQTRKLLVVK